MWHATRTHFLKNNLLDLRKLKGWKPCNTKDSNRLQTKFYSSVEGRIIFRTLTRIRVGNFAQLLCSETLGGDFFAGASRPRICGKRSNFHLIRLFLGFQTLELLVQIFPKVGKNQMKTSNHWKTKKMETRSFFAVFSRFCYFFQGLEPFSLFFPNLGKTPTATRVER